MGDEHKTGGFGSSDTEPLLPVKNDEPKLFLDAWNPALFNPDADGISFKQQQFNAGVAVLVTAYGETAYEIANNLKTFEGETNAHIHLSIMLDGHSTEEKREKSETFQAYNDLLIKPYGEGSVEEFGCLVFYGKLQNVPWRLYVKGAALARGQHNSHKLFYSVLDARVKAGKDRMPGAFLHMDADTGSPNGASDVERLLVVFLNTRTWPLSGLASGLSTRGRTYAQRIRSSICRR